MKNIKYIIIATIIGIIIGKYIFNQYNTKTIKTINTTTNVYLLQYGVYSDINNMKNNSKDIPNYLYFYDKDGYHVFIGITKNKKNFKKIVDSYQLSVNIYMKRVKIDNENFIELLNQYEKVISQTDDKKIILNAQKQLLSLYEELIIKNEQSN